MTKKTRHLPPQYQTCFIIQKTSCYEEQGIDFFAVKKNIFKVNN